MVLNCFFIRYCAYWICLSVNFKPVSIISLSAVFRLCLLHLTHMSSSTPSMLQLAVAERSTTGSVLLEGVYSMASSFTTGQPFESSLAEAIHLLDWNKPDSFLIQLLSPMKQRVQGISIPPSFISAQLQCLRFPVMVHLITPPKRINTEHGLDMVRGTWPTILSSFHNAYSIYVVYVFRLPLTLQLFSYYWFPYRAIYMVTMYGAINCQRGRT